MEKIQNEYKTWDAIWEKSTEIDIIALSNQIKQTKETKLSKEYTKIVNEKFGGWKNINSIELGSGIGWYSMVAATEGAKVTLLDYSLPAIELGKKRFELLNIPASFIYGDAFDIVKKSKTDYNLSWSFGTAEHFSSDLRQKFFDLHFDFLIKKGVTIISCPYKYSLNYRIWMHYAVKYNMWDFGLEIPYSKKEFLSRLKNSNNHLIKIIFDQGSPCLRKAVSVLRQNSKIRFLTIGMILKIFMKITVNISPFCFRSILLVAEKK